MHLLDAWSEVADDSIFDYAARGLELRDDAIGDWSDAGIALAGELHELVAVDEYLDPSLTESKVGRRFCGPR